MITTKAWLFIPLSYQHCHKPKCCEVNDFHDTYSIHPAQGTTNPREDLNLQHQCIYDFEIDFNEKQIPRFLERS